MGDYALPQLCACGVFIESCPDHAPRWAWVEPVIADKAMTWSDGTPIPDPPPEDFDPWEQP